jgi:hypothetical protein
MNERLIGPGPLPVEDGLRVGLSVVSAMAMLSWCSTITLLLHLLWKLVRWRIYLSRRPEFDGTTAKTTARSKDQTRGRCCRSGGAASDVGMAMPINVPMSHFPLHGSAMNRSRSKSRTNGAASVPDVAQSRERAPNQFFMLILNLLLADNKQATAFVLNLKWLRIHLIDTECKTCWVQGWFVSVGDLAVSLE